MKSNVYSIYDKKSESYSPPFIAYNHTCAKRMVAAAMTEGSLLKMFPNDYRLDFIGTFEDAFGNFKSFANKDIVCEVSNLVVHNSVCNGDDVRVGDGQTAEVN